jgi:hypothetical protein
MIPDITGESPMAIIITIATRARGIITDIQSASRNMEIAMRDGTSRDISQFRDNNRKKPRHRFRLSMQSRRNEK